VAASWSAAQTRVVLKYWYARALAAFEGVREDGQQCTAPRDVALGVFTVDADLDPYGGTS
jgi:hypothetical protein